MKKIIIIFIIAIVVFFVLYQYKINYIDIKHDDFSITKQFILESIEDKRNIVININGQLIDIDDFEIQKKALDVYTEKEQNELNKNNEIIETIKHVVVLQEAEKEKITPDFDVKAMETIASGMYENSDKVLSKDEYIKKWVEIQKENEIKSIYMAEIMEKIINNEIETNDDKVKSLIENYNKEKNVKNLRAAYEAYVESIIEEYELEISNNGEKIYNNFN